MTVQAIPFAPSQESGADQLGGAQALAENVVVDSKGTVRKRPGIAAFFTAGASVEVDPEGIDAVHITDGGMVYAIGRGLSSRYVYACSPGGSVRMNGAVIGVKRPTVAETQGYLMFAAGARVEKHQLGGTSLEALGGDPPLTSHVVAHASRILAMDIDENRNSIHYSAPQAGVGIGGYEQWNGDGDSSMFTADQRPDELRAIKENTNELFAFGARTTQVFSPDIRATYVPSATREIGCSAPHSIVKDDQSFAWLDDRRRLIHSDAREYQALSPPIQADLDTISSVADCFGYRLTEGETDALIWTFPSDERTFAYSRGKGWSQWASWEPSRSNRGLFIVSAAATSPLTGRTVVGTRDGRMGVFSRTTGTDLGDEFRAQVQTGFIDRGTYARKRCNSVRLSLRRGRDATDATVPKALLSWRDDEGEWGQPIEVDLGVIPDREIVVPFYSLGTYRKRQWRFSFLSGVGLELAGAVEDFTAQEI